MTRWLSLMVWVSMGWLLTVVLKLGLVEGGMYQGMARGNRVAEMSVPASRGVMSDRRGRIVAESVYQYFREENGNKIYLESGGYKPSQFETKDLSVEIKRKYPYGEVLGHVTGYVGMVTPDELKEGEKCPNKSLKRDDVVGRGGVEETFDCQLQGNDGKRLVEVDALGRYVRELGRVEPEEGKELRLSLDAYWQDKVYKLLSGRRAVVIISEPDTGKVRVMVSSPGFDPNVFSFEKDDTKIKDYLNDDKNLPLLNRAIAAKYHPGSVFKLAVAVAGLESGVINGGTLIEDTGFIKVGEYTYNNWLWTKRGGTDGLVSIVSALKKSNDIFFYRLGEKTGAGQIRSWAEKMGMGKETGVELPGELAGLVPDDKWKKEVKGESWFLGNTYHMAIGQGDVATTPLQINLETNVIANGGIKCRPTLLEEAGGQCDDLKITKSTIDLVVEGMEQACKSGGTAWPLFNFKTKLACKTGTAEVGDGSKETHAWLTAFAPADDPEISITVLVERGGEGSDTAAPIVGDILKEWFEEPNTVVPRYKE